MLGCWQCHGSPVKVLPNGDLDSATWPNSGIGRINPDGSRGSCAACHQRHEFSIAQARRPEACGKCHLGPDHPQKEIYDESKHGISFYANVDKMNLNSAKWVVGEDYNVAPTCATCHMSATSEQPLLTMSVIVLAGPCVQLFLKKLTLKPLKKVKLLNPGWIDVKT
jgi:hypothetical protein